MQKTRKKEKIQFGLTEVVLLVSLTCVFALGLGYFLGNHKDPSETYVEDAELNKFVKNYHYIIDNYYNKVDRASLIDHAIRGMVESLGDDYSSFMTEEESNTFDIRLTGEYSGIGIVITRQEESVVVLSVYKGTVADKAGIKEGDILKEINHKTVATQKLNEITDSIQKQKGEMTFTFERDGQSFEKKLTKEKVVLDSVSSKMIDPDRKIGYIKVDIFALNTAEQFKKALEELKKNDMKSLIIDVRGNGGGHLSAAEEVASLFLDTSHVVYQTDAKGKKTKVYSKGKETSQFPIYFLTDNETASGSELLVAALTENIDAKIVGKTTYGKGTVQELIPLTTGSEYKVTVKKWLTPKGNWIDEYGIDPDIDVDLSDAYYKDRTEANDTQLQKALEMMK